VPVQPFAGTGAALRSAPPVSGCHDTDPNRSCYRRRVRDHLRNAGLLLIAGALAQVGCSSDSCTTMGCSSLAVIAGELPAPSGNLTVEACRNGACSSASDLAPEGCRSVGTLPSLHICFESGATLRIDVAIYHDSSAAPPTDGDVYTLQVRDASGATLVDFSGSATYRVHRPNGDGCDPVCKTAELAF
jgi:hypothetical protein